MSSFITAKANDNISIYVAMELLNDTLENFLKTQSEDERIISQKLSSQGSLPQHKEHRL